MHLQQVLNPIMAGKSPVATSKSPINPESDDFSSSSPHDLPTLEEIEGQFGKQVAAAYAVAIPKMRKIQGLLGVSLFAGKVYVGVEKKQYMSAIKQQLAQCLPAEMLHVVDYACMIQMNEA